MQEWLTRLLSAAPSHQANVTQLNKWLFLLTRDGIIPAEDLRRVWYFNGPFYPDVDAAVEEAGRANRMRVAHAVLSVGEERTVHLVGAAAKDASVEQVAKALVRYQRLTATQLAKMCYDDAPFLIQKTFRWQVLGQAEELVAAARAKKHPQVGLIADAMLQSYGIVMVDYPTDDADNLLTLRRYMDEAAYITSQLLDGDGTTLPHAQVLQKLLQALWELVASAIRLDTEDGQFPELRPEWRASFRRLHDLADARLHEARGEVELLFSESASTASSSPEKPGRKLAHAYLKHNARNEE